MTFNEDSDRPDKEDTCGKSGYARENEGFADHEVPSFSVSQMNDSEKNCNVMNDLETWKKSLRCDFESWLESVNEILAPEAEPPVEPDLYSFYEQLIVANAENRKGNRRTAEAFSRWGDILTGFESDLHLVREQLSRRELTIMENAPLPRKYCLALIELFDRLHRISQAFDSTPATSWWRRDDAEWRKIWETQQKAFLILTGHFRDLLSGEGIKRMKCLGRPFDPAEMTAIDTDSNHREIDNLVVEEYAPGYYRHEELLRPAQVKINVNGIERTSS